MELEKANEGGYKIINLLMMESHFKRLANVTFNHPDIKSMIDISVNSIVKENEVFVTESVRFEHKYNEVDEISAVITMVGIFERIGEFRSPPEEFGDVNGAAIIFPYIREQLSLLSLKAGVGQIILPPVNFIKMHEEKKRNKST